MCDKDLIIKKLNEIHGLEIKLEMLSALIKVRIFEFNSRYKFKNGLLDEECLKYEAKAKFLKCKVVDRYKSIYFKHRLDEYQVVFKISMKAASYVDAPLRMVCSPANLEMMSNCMSMDKGRSCSQEMPQLMESYNEWLSENDDYEAWFQQIEDRYDKLHSNYINTDFEELDRIVELDKDASILLHHATAESGYTIYSVEKWLSHFDPNLVKIEEVRIGKLGKVKLIRGLKFINGINVETELLGLPTF